mgnify:CR=1 FL=1
METLNHRAYQVTQLACIVNQLHRMAMRMPPDALPSGMTISQLSTIGFLYFSQQGDVYQKDIESFFKLRRSTVSWTHWRKRASSSGYLSPMMPDSKSWFSQRRDCGSAVRYFWCWNR